MSLPAELSSGLKMMKTIIVKKLNRINKEFYEKVADEFDQTRQNIWTGWEEFLKYAKVNNPGVGFVLDVGCGNGRLAPLIIQNFPASKYIGVDGNSSLIEKAKERNSSSNVDFIHMDIDRYLSLPNETRYDLITLIATIHHIPGKENRIELLKKLSKLLTDKGMLVISFWQFMENPKLKDKVLDWNIVGIDKNKLEKNDYLLGWNNQKGIYRYCHHHNDEEINKIIEKAKLKVVKEFSYTGRSGKMSKTIMLRAGV